MNPVRRQGRLLLELSPCRLRQVLLRPEESTWQGPPTHERLFTTTNQEHLEPLLPNGEHDQVDGDRDRRMRIGNSRHVPTLPISRQVDD